MSQPTALDEIAAYRVRLTDARQKATDTLSLSLRTVGFGLAAVSYSFVFSSTPSTSLVDQKIFLFVGSGFGAFSVLLDVAQSFKDRHSAQATLDFMKDCAATGRRPTPQELVETRNINGASDVFHLLIARTICCFIGVVAVLSGIVRTI